MNYKQIYSMNAGTMYFIDEVSELIGRQNYDKALRAFRSFTESFQILLGIILSPDASELLKTYSINYKQVTMMLADVLKAQEQKDYILAADLLKLQIEPFLISLQDALRSLDRSVIVTDVWQENLNVLKKTDKVLADIVVQQYEKLQKTNQDYIFRDEERETTYYIEETGQGYVTLKIENASGAYYLYSNYNLSLAANLFAEEYTEEEAKSYHVLGLGLGYHGGRLALKEAYAKPVHIYEADINVIVLAMMYRIDIKSMESCNMFLHYDPDCTKLVKALQEPKAKLAIHYPSLRNLENKEIRNSFEKYFISESAYRNQKNVLKANFNYNQQYMHEVKNARPIDELIDDWSKKSVYIIAAGPSLDQNIALLKQKPNDAVIIATGTVFKKLLAMQLKPDYVFVTDGNDRVVYQMSGAEHETVPMLLLCTANKGFVQKYNGNKYMIYQKDYPFAEEYANEHNLTLYETGGSVSTTALDVAIRRGAGRIIFLGLDLAFTNNLAHAEGTSSRIASQETDLIPVTAYNKKDKVLADYKFIMYREWMEKRLLCADAKNIPIINATQGGSYIEGMCHITLEEAMQNKNN